MVNCAFENYGCAGGYLIPAIDFLVSEGVAPEICVPYEERDTMKCSSKCSVDERFAKIKYQKYYCKPGSLKISTNVREIQKEIYENGSVVVSLLVYEDFYNFKEGIYHNVAG